MVSVNDRRARQSWVGALVLLVVLAGCTADRVDGPTIQGLPGPGGGRCNAVEANSVLLGLFRDLTAGRHISVPTFFVPPQAFVQWIDPDAGQITADTGNGGATLASLQSRLDDLSDQGVTISLTSFNDQGFRTTSGESGDWFTFAARAVAFPAGPSGPATGRGVADCATGKIKEFVLGQW